MNWLMAMVMAAGFSVPHEQTDVHRPGYALDYSTRGGLPRLGPAPIPAVQVPLAPDGQGIRVRYWGLDFDGDDLITADDAGLPDGTTDRTIEMWVWPDDSPLTHIFPRLRE